VQYHPKGVKENIQCTKQKRRKKKSTAEKKRRETGKEIWVK